MSDLATGMGVKFWEQNKLSRVDGTHQMMQTSEHINALLTNDSILFVFRSLQLQMMLGFLKRSLQIYLTVSSTMVNEHP